MKLYILSACLLVASVSNAEILNGLESVSNLNGDGARYCQLTVNRDEAGNITSGALSLKNTLFGGDVSAQALKETFKDSDGKITLNNDDGEEKDYLELVVSQDKSIVASSINLDSEPSWGINGPTMVDVRTTLFSCIFK